MALSKKIENNNHDRKYIALSFIYRAVKGVSEFGGCLSEYLASASGLNGIADSAADNAACCGDAGGSAGYEDGGCGCGGGGVDGGGAGGDGTDGDYSDGNRTSSIISGIYEIEQTGLFLHGTDLLRGIVAFHISAGSRSRYAKTYYYMCVIHDINIYLQREDEFRHYLKDVIMQNSRRPALRNEMSIVYG